MARPWKPRISVYPALFLKPQVAIIAGRINQSVAAAVGSLVRLWLEAQVRANDDGRIVGRDKVWVDALVGCVGFADAMVCAGWLVVDGNDLIVPDFNQSISKKAVRRIEHADRMAQARESENSSHILSTYSAHTPHKVLDVPTVPVVPPEKPPPKAKSKKQAAVEDVRFWRFYKAYPRQHGQVSAYEEWEKLAPDDALVEVILAAVEAQKKSNHWRKDNGDFIPIPKNWLKDRRWEDRIIPLGPVQSGARVKSGEGKYGRKPEYGATPGGEVPPGTQLTLFPDEAP